MKRTIIYTLLLLFSIATTSAQPSSSERWDAGNKAYMAGAYNQATEEYHAILDGGEYSLELYYNLANAYFKMDSLGKAILYYNKALRIDPSHEDALYNLAIAEARTKDKITEVPEFFLNGWMRSIRDTLSCNTWSVLSILFFAIFLGGALLFLLTSAIRLRKVGFYGALSALIIFVVATSFAVSSRNNMLSHDEAIVTASAISVKSSPDHSSTDLFVLHEGTKVRVVSEMENWAEVVIADGKKGWTEKRNFEKI